MIIKGYIFSILYALVCLALAFVAYKLGLPKKYSRKMVHILVGAEWIILSYYMGASYHFLAVCLLFLVILAVAHFKNLMPMISSESDNAPGTVYYAVAMSLMAVICLFVEEMMYPFGIGVFCTSVGDGFAGIVGQLVKKHNPKVYKNKSLLGTLPNFACSSLVAIIFKEAFDLNLAIWQCFAIGVLAVGLELITAFGLDNISITVGVSLLAYAFINYPVINEYFVPIIVTPLIIAVVLEKKVLTKIGLLFAMVLDAVISLILGNFGFVMLCAFLFGSVIIDKIKHLKKKEDTITKKGDCRDAIQVMANGLVPMMMALLYSGTGHVAFIIGYVAALAEAFADTAASGFGVFASKVYDVFKMKETKPGLSGGMSIVGTVSSLCAAVAISTIALAFDIVNIKFMLIIAGAAFLGAVFDSMLGSLLQVKFKCKTCGEITEREIHCKKPTVKCAGFYFFDNDVVNFFSGFFAAILGTVLYAVL